MRESDAYNPELAMRITTTQVDDQNPFDDSANQTPGKSTNETDSSVLLAATSENEQNAKAEVMREFEEWMEELRKVLSLSDDEQEEPYLNGEQKVQSMTYEELVKAAQDMDDMFMMKHIAQDECFGSNDDEDEN